MASFGPFVFPSWSRRAGSSHHKPILTLAWERGAGRWGWAGWKRTPVDSSRRLGSSQQGPIMELGSNPHTEAPLPHIFPVEPVPPVQSKSRPQPLAPPLLSLLSARSPRHRGLLSNPGPRHLQGREGRPGLQRLAGLCRILAGSSQESDITSLSPVSSSEKCRYHSFPCKAGMRTE